MTTDCYAVLGVRRDANADEIKMAYRRLARELHPDVNADPAAQERFKQVTQAHEVLSDPVKRQMHDLGGDPFTAAGGSFSHRQAEHPETDGYPQDRWEPHRERWPPQHPSAGARNQSRDQALYSDYLGRQPPSFSYDWRLPPAVKPYRPRPIPVAVVLMCAVLALGVLVAVRVVSHRPGLQTTLHATLVTTTKTISVLNATWAPPPSGATPAMTAKRAWVRWTRGMSIGRPTVQLGLITRPVAPSACGPECPVRNGITYQALNLLAYGYYWTSCDAGKTLPAAKCWNWLFLNANTGGEITEAHYDMPSVDAP